MTDHFAYRFDAMHARSGRYTRLDLSAMRRVFGRARSIGTLRHVCRMMRIAKRRAV